MIWEMCDVKVWWSNTKYEVVIKSPFCLISGLFCNVVNLNNLLVAFSKVKNGYVTVLDIFLFNWQAQLKYVNVLGYVAIVALFSLLLTSRGSINNKTES